MRDLEQKRGDWWKRISHVRERKQYIFLTCCFFLKKSFDAVGKIPNILSVERGGLGGHGEWDGTGTVPYDDIVNLLTVDR